MQLPCTSKHSFFVKWCACPSELVSGLILLEGNSPERARDQTLFEQNVQIGACPTVHLQLKAVI